VRVQHARQNTGILSSEQKLRAFTEHALHNEIQYYRPHKGNSQGDEDCPEASIQIQAENQCLENVNKEDMRQIKKVANSAQEINRLVLKIECEQKENRYQ
jgi:hypothetical protein